MTITTVRNAHRSLAGCRGPHLAAAAVGVPHQRREPVDRVQRERAHPVGAAQAAQRHRARGQAAQAAQPGTSARCPLGWLSKAARFPLYSGLVYAICVSSIRARVPLRQQRRKRVAEQACDTGPCGAIGGRALPKDSSLANARERASESESERESESEK